MSVTNDSDESPQSSVQYWRCSVIKAEKIHLRTEKFIVLLKQFNVPIIRQTLYLVLRICAHHNRQQLIITTGIFILWTVRSRKSSICNAQAYWGSGGLVVGLTGRRRHLSILRENWNSETYWNTWLRSAYIFRSVSFCETRDTQRVLNHLHRQFW